MDLATIRRIANRNYDSANWKECAEKGNPISEACFLAAHIASSGGGQMEGYSENPNKHAFWEELTKLKPELALEQFKNDTLQGHFSEWKLKTMPFSEQNGFIGFAYYSPSLMVRLTNYNLGNRGRMKRKRYHIDLAKMPGVFPAEGSTVMEIDDEHEAFKQALLHEKIQKEVLDMKLRKMVP